MVSYPFMSVQNLIQDLETGCPKLAIVKFWGVHIFMGDHNILKFSTTNMYAFVYRGPYR